MSLQALLKAAEKAKKSAIQHSQHRVASIKNFNFTLDVLRNAKDKNEFEKLKKAALVNLKDVESTNHKLWLKLGDWTYNLDMFIREAEKIASDVPRSNPALKKPIQIYAKTVKAMTSSHYGAIDLMNEEVHDLMQTIPQLRKVIQNAAFEDARR